MLLIHPGDTSSASFISTKRPVGGERLAILNPHRGYLFFEADDLDAAIELASQIPAASIGGPIEVRPMVQR